MVKALRKRHLQAWVALAVLIPVGITAAVEVRPTPARDVLLQAHAAPALPILLTTLDKLGYSASLRCNADTTMLQLEWVNKKVLTVPSALIYQLSATGTENGLVVGRVEAVGTYRFSLLGPLYPAVRLRLYDIVHHYAIDSITFK